ncbi:hypothetical protein CTA2_4490 [Colletotrichum tanaceti]|nr:hypothetical protein CTA2_4490 [Colletotrichum tanaceti]
MKSASHGQLNNKATFADIPKASDQSDSQDNDASHLQPIAEVHALDKKNRPQRKPGFAESLSSLTEQHLNIDLLDDKQEVLQNSSRISLTQSSCWRTRFNTTPPTLPAVLAVIPKTTTSLSDHPFHGAASLTGSSARNSHMHEPRRAKASSNGDSGLEAQVEIINLRAYLSSHPELAASEKQETYAAVLSPLLEFLKDNYEQAYQEAEDMFHEGYVNALHLDKLFKPNQMVTNCKNPEALEAFGVHEDPQSYKFGAWPTKVGPRDELPISTIMLLPATTYGFNLHEKKWVHLNIGNLHPVDWNKKAFERLVLEPKTKEMIHALVDVQTAAKKMDDIVTGKGNGLILLLQGSPGTGKTLTAESVAEIAEKPLCRVTCGDIGIDARDVEKYLQTVMYLGKVWDCVFLRILEYYEGILILTSNRVGTFDEAFKSRIQVAIHYDGLTKKSHRVILRNFFDMIEDSSDEEANMPELERRLDQLAQEEMNGRQIRNALLTSRQLAKHRNERLNWDHLSQVMKTSAAFNKYLKAVRGHSDEQWAPEEMLR